MFYIVFSLVKRKGIGGSSNITYKEDVKKIILHVFYSLQSVFVSEWEF